MRERKEFQTEKEEVQGKTGRKSLLAQKFCTVQQRFSDQYEKVIQKEDFPFDLAMKPSSIGQKTNPRVTMRLLLPSLLSQFYQPARKTKKKNL